MTGTKPLQHQLNIALGEGETTFTAAQFSSLLKHLWFAIPGTVDNDGAGFRRTVLWLQPNQPA